MPLFKKNALSTSFSLSCLIFFISSSSWLHTGFQEVHNRGWTKDLLTSFAQKIYFWIEKINTQTLEQSPAFKPEIVRNFASTQLCTSEQSFLLKREAITSKNLRPIIGDRAVKVPRIGVALSGGGFRAMILSLGFLKGLEDAGLLDSITYLAALSGSTWAVAPWLASGESLTNHSESLSKKLIMGLRAISERKQLEILSKVMCSKHSFKQSFSSIDIYGPLIGNTLLYALRDTRLTTTLSASHAELLQGTMPLPLYTAINTDIVPYDWMTFTPFEAHSTDMDLAIPLNTFGNNFANGTQTHDGPESTLAYMMGIFGSAFTLTIQDYIRQTTVDIVNLNNHLETPVQKLVSLVLNELLNTPLSTLRAFPAEVPNFGYGVKGCPLISAKSITLADAGIDINIPVPVLLHPARSLDIIIIYDGSSEINNGRELKLSETYARRKGYKFPPIDYRTIGQQPISIFTDPNDPTCPTVIYFPFIKNDSYSNVFDPMQCVETGYCGTFNFTYTEEQFFELYGLARSTVNQCADQIRKAIVTTSQQTL